MTELTRDLDALLIEYQRHTVHTLGEEFLARASEALASLLGARLVFVTRALNDPTTRVAIVAASVAGLPAEFDLAGTPCELTYKGQNVEVHEGLARRFVAAKDSGNEAFVGFPFYNDSSRCIGHIGIFFEHPTVLARDVFRIVEAISGRIGAELNRLELETVLASSRQRLAFHNSVLEMVTQNVQRDTTLDTFIRGVEAEHSGMRCSLMLPDQGGGNLELVAAPSLPPDYLFAISRVPLGDAGGACGKAAVTQEPVFVPDISQVVSTTPIAEQAWAAGLRSCWSFPVIDVGGKLLAVFAVYHDYVCSPSSEDLKAMDVAVGLLRHVMRHYREAELLEQRTQRYQLFLRNSIDGVMIVEADGRFIEVSEGFLRQIGAAHRRDLGDTRVWDWLAAMDEAGYHSLVRSLVDGPCQFETRMRRTDGAELDAEIHATAFRNDGQLAIWASARDITERKHLEAELTRRANFDHLTGLANRAAFLECLTREFHRCRRHGRSLAVMMLDIDHFKSVNDRHGHQAGDRSLAALAEVCLATVRTEDCVGRLGGDELAVLMPESDLLGACDAAERLRQAIASYVIELGAGLGGAAIAITSSIGVAVYADDNDEFALLNRADQALYRAKAHGRNRVELDAGAVSGY